MILWKISSPIVADWSSYCFFPFLWCCLMNFFSFFMNFSSFISSRFLLSHYFFFFVLSGCESQRKILKLVVSDGKWKRQVFMFTFYPSKWSCHSRGLYMEKLLRPLGEPLMWSSHVLPPNKKMPPIHFFKLISTSSLSH